MKASGDWNSTVAAYDAMMSSVQAVFDAIEETDEYGNDMACTTSDDECDLASFLLRDIVKHRKYFTVSTQQVSF